MNGVDRHMHLGGCMDRQTDRHTHRELATRQHGCIYMYIYIYKYTLCLCTAIWWKLTESSIHPSMLFSLMLLRYVYIFFRYIYRIRKVQG